MCDKKVQTFYVVVNGLHDAEFQQPEFGMPYSDNLSENDPRMPRSSATRGGTTRGGTTRGGGGGAASPYLSKGCGSSKVGMSDKDQARLPPGDDRTPQLKTCESLTGQNFDMSVFPFLLWALQVSTKNGRPVPARDAPLDDPSMCAPSENRALNDVEQEQHDQLCRELQRTANEGRSRDQKPYTITSGTRKLVFDISALNLKKGDQLGLSLMETPHDKFGNLNRPIDVHVLSKAQLRELLQHSNAESLLENPYSKWFWQSWYKGCPYSRPYDNEGNLEQGGDRHGWYPGAQSMSLIARRSDRADLFCDLRITGEMQVSSVQRDKESDKRTAQVTSTTDFEAGSRSKIAPVSGGAFGPPVLGHGQVHVAVIEIYGEHQPEEQPAQKQAVFADTAGECAVCLEHEHEFRLFTPCGHTLCTKCWARIKANPKCPQCKQSVLTTANITASQLGDAEDKAAQVKAAQDRAAQDREVKATSLHHEQAEKLVDGCHYNFGDGDHDMRAARSEAKHTAAQLFAAGHDEAGVYEKLLSSHPAVIRPDCIFCPTEPNTSPTAGSSSRSKAKRKHMERDDEGDVIVISSDDE